MLITSVSYSNLRNLGNYENEKIGADCAVAAGEDPALALATLKEWVQAQFEDTAEQRELSEGVAELRMRRQHEERLLERAEGRWKAYVEFTKKLGGTIPDEFAQDIPF